MNATLVFIPCHMGSATVFKDQIANFENHYPIYVADTFSHQSISDMAKTALDAVSGAIIPIGLSMGGYVAMEMNYQAAHRLSGLVIMDSNPYAESEQRRNERLAEHDLIHRGRYTGMTRAGVKRMISRTSMENTDLVDQIIAMAKAPGQAIYEAQMRAIIERRDYVATIKTCPCSALILYGAEDQVTPPEYHHDMSHMFPSSQLIEIPDAGHLISMEKPDEVNQHLQAYLEGIKYPE